MRAIILAAGTGSRLRSVTSGPKALLELHGRPVLGHQLALLAAVGIDDVVAVVGHEADAIRTAFPDLATVEYAAYASSNNLWTLSRHRRLVDGDVLILFADVLVTSRALGALVADDSEAGVLVDSTARRSGTMRVAMRDGEVIDMGNHIEPDGGDGNFLGIARTGARASEVLSRALRVMGHDERHRHDYYTQALLCLPHGGVTLTGVDVAGEPWLEIDTSDDLAEAVAVDFYVV